MDRSERIKRVEQALSKPSICGLLHISYKENEPRKNDNLAALVMHSCIVKICEGIEFDDSRKIAEGLVELKKYTNDFEVIFHENLANGCYRN